MFFCLFYVLFEIVKCQWIAQRSESWKMTTEKLRGWKTFYSLDHRKSKGILKKKKRKIYSASLTMLKLLTVWITTNWNIPKEMGIPGHLTYLLRNLVCRTRSNSQNWSWNNGLVQIWERSTSRQYIVMLFISLICRVHCEKCQAGWHKSLESISPGEISITSYTQVIPL